MVEAPLPASVVQAKVQEYEAFVNDVLKEDLKKTQQSKAELLLEIKEYDELEQNLQRLKEDGCPPLKLHVDIGSEVLGQAHAPDTSCVYISVGLGFHVGVALDDAPRVIAIRRAALSRKKEDALEQVAKIKANIRMAENAMAELMKV